MLFGVCFCSHLAIYVTRTAPKTREWNSPRNKVASRLQLLLEAQLWLNQFNIIKPNLLPFYTELKLVGRKRSLSMLFAVIFFILLKLPLLCFSKNDGGKNAVLINYSFLKTRNRFVTQSPVQQQYIRRTQKYTTNKNILKIQWKFKCFKHATNERKIKKQEFKLLPFQMLFKHNCNF